MTSTSFEITNSRQFKSLMKTIKLICWTELKFIVRGRTLFLNDTTSDGTIMLKYEINRVNIGDCQTITLKSTDFLKILRTMKNDDVMSFLVTEEEVQITLLKQKYIYTFPNLETSSKTIISFPDLRGLPYFGIYASSLNADLNSIISVTKGLVNIEMNQSRITMKGEGIKIIKQCDYGLEESFCLNYKIGGFYLPAKHLCHVFFHDNKLIIRSQTNGMDLLLIYIGEKLI